MNGFTVSELGCAENHKCEGHCPPAHNAQFIDVESTAHGVGYNVGETVPDASVEQMHAARMTARGVLAMLAVRVMREYPHWTLSSSFTIDEEDDWTTSPMIGFFIPAGNAQDKPRKAITDALTDITAFLSRSLPDDLPMTGRVRDIVQQEHALQAALDDAKSIAPLLDDKAKPWLTYLHTIDDPDARRAEVERMRAEIPRIILNRTTEGATP